MYFSIGATHAWIRDLDARARSERWGERVDLFICPDLLTLASAVAVLHGSGIEIGAQDVFWEETGPYTGEVSPSSLSELGCRYVEVGHAERRALFAESDAVVASKAAAVTRNRLIPVVCIGELRRTSIRDAVRACEPQIAAVFDCLPRDADVVLAYEPVWAIGQASAADPTYVRAVIGQLRERFDGRALTTRWIYGGSAGPNLFGGLSGTVDGLFLGRSAHDLEQLARIVDEVASTTASAEAEQLT